MPDSMTSNKEGLMSGDQISTVFKDAYRGKHVVVTGAAAGIGVGIAAGFAWSGATVRIADLSPKVEDTATDLRARGYDVSAEILDVTDEEAVKAFFDRIGQDFGKLDVLVSQAGIIEISKLEDTTAQSFERVLRVNTLAQFIAAREAVPLIRKAGGGSIINAASAQARHGFIYTPSYAASKFGVVGLTQSLAKELAKDNIRVNSYCPGIVVTDMWAYNDKKWGELLGDYRPGELMQEWIDAIPMGRAATKEDVANLVLFLASDAADYITGQAINIDGGMEMN